MSEGPRREKKSEKIQNTTHFRHHGHWYNHTCHWFGRNAQIPLENGDLKGVWIKKALFCLRPRRASVRDGVRRGCYCVRAVCYCVQPTGGIEITTLISREISRN